MNTNLEKLCEINFLINNLFFNDLKYNSVLMIQIISELKQIKNNISFLITEFYFTDIIQFTSVKKKIINHLIFIKNNLFVFNVDLNLIIEINQIIDKITKIYYPAHLTTTNNNKYVNEIQQVKIKFYHKTETLKMDNMDNNNSDYDNDNDDSNVIDIDNTNTNNNLINKKLKIHENKATNKKEQIDKNYTFDKIKKYDFVKNIDFTKSYISI